MLNRAHIMIAAAAFLVAPCYAAQLSVRDGSTKAKAIPLRQRGEKAVEEEMQWMMQLFHYTPVFATRDAAANLARQIKAGKKSVEAVHPWEHLSLEHHGKLISYWSLLTPRGRREIYFDTGALINTPGEVARQERVRAEYTAKKWQSFNER